MNIYVDIDDVLTENLSLMIEYLNKYKVGPYIKYNEVTDWNYFNKLYPRECIEESFGYAIRNTYFKKRSRTALIELLREDKFNVHLLTATLKKFKEDRLEWIRKNMPWFPPEKIIFEKNKAKYSGGILIDDGIHNVDRYKGFSFLVDMPHNRGYKIKSNQLRVRSLAEAVKIIKEGGFYEFNR
jgi:5'(3')-deoxyribonucleotidase